MQYCFVWYEAPQKRRPLPKIQQRTEAAALQPVLIPRLNYAELTDAELLLLSKTNEDAIKALMVRYRWLIRKLATRYFAPGLELDDFMQEAYFGLYKGVKSFDPSKIGAQKASAFISCVIERQVITALKTATRQKQKILAESSSLDEVREDPKGRPGRSLFERVADPKALDPSDACCNGLDTEYNSVTLREMINNLTPLEKDVLRHWYSGFGMNDIALILKVQAKAVDNALQRIKSKARKIKKSKGR